MPGTDIRPRLVFPTARVESRLERDLGGIFGLRERELRRRGGDTRMYWTIGQMIAHHTSSGCDLRGGDLLGSGTISGPDCAAFGSLVEINAGGRNSIILPTGEERRFLADGDEVVLTGRLDVEGFASIGSGECRGTVVGQGTKAGTCAIDGGRAMDEPVRVVPRRSGSGRFDGLRQ